MFIYQCSNDIDNDLYDHLNKTLDYFRKKLKLYKNPQNLDILIF